MCNNNDFHKSLDKAMKTDSKPLGLKEFDKSREDVLASLLTIIQERQLPKEKRPLDTKKILQEIITSPTFQESMDSVMDKKIREAVSEESLKKLAHEELHRPVQDVLARVDSDNDGSCSDRSSDTSVSPNETTLSGKRKKDKFVEILKSAWKFVVRVASVNE